MLYFVIIAVVIVVTAISVRVSKRGKTAVESDEGSTVIVSKDAKQLAHLVKQLPVQIKWNEGEHYIVEFQGGTFFLYYMPPTDSYKLEYPKFEGIRNEQYISALTVANSIHNKYNSWRCLLSSTEEGENEDAYTVSLSCDIPLWNENKALELITVAMKMAFVIARDFSTEFEKVNKEDDSTIERLKEADFRNKVALVRNRLETRHGVSEQEEPDADDGLFTMGSLLKLYADVEFGALLEMHILAEGKSEVIRRVEDIIKFNVYDCIKQHHTEDWAKEFALHLKFEKDGLMLCLSRAEGCTDKTLFYLLRTYRMGGRKSNDVGSYCRDIRFAIRLGSPDEALAEAKYMIEEAMSKEKESGFDSLSDMEQEIVALVQPTYQADMYWARRYYEAGMLYQSLAHFRNIYNHYRENWKDLNDRGKSNYHRVCFYMGFVYMDLNLTERAFYFLTIALQSNGLDAYSEYINCLCNMKDPITISIISSHLEGVKKAMSEERNDVALTNFWLFLERRLTYAQIYMKLYEEAHSRLRKMIENDYNVDFAKHELEYLENLMRSNEEKGGQ